MGAATAHVAAAGSAVESTTAAGGAAMETAAACIPAVHDAWGVAAAAHRDGAKAGRRAEGAAGRRHEGGAGADGSSATNADGAEFGMGAHDGVAEALAHGPALDGMDSWSERLNLFPFKGEGPWFRARSGSQLEGFGELLASVDRDQTRSRRYGMGADRAGSDAADGRAVRARRRNIASGNIPDCRVRVPAGAIESVTAVARHPHPAHGIHEVPGATVVGHPPPRVAGDPGVAKAGIVAPGAIAEGIPAGADAGGRPGLAIARDVVPGAVVVEVVPGGPGRGKNSTDPRSPPRRFGPG